MVQSIFRQQPAQRTPYFPRAKPVIDRTTAVNSLRKQKVFRYASLRLLSDLIELWNERPEPTEWTEDQLPPPYQLVRLGRNSFSLFWSLRPQGRRIRDLRTEGPKAHLVWVSARQGFEVPVMELTQLLAVSIADQFDEHTAIVTFDEAAARLEVWDPQARSFIPIDPWRRPGAVQPKDGIDELNECWGGELYHVFFVAPTLPAGVPDAFKDQRCHRIVYLADRLPKRVPPDLEERLIPEVKSVGDSDPYFSSFIATLIGNDVASRDAVGSSRSDKFKAVRVDDEFQPAPRGRGWRLARDHCRLHLGLDDLSGQCVRGLRDQTYPTCVTRWARAVTNRQVGLALSGGGASSYRMVPLLRGLNGFVPIDVVSGVSGGALLGAYYCKAGGSDGLEKFVSSGWEFTAGVLRAITSTAYFERLIDRHLEGTRIEDLELRFVPLTTALCDPPEARVVVRGTLGEGVVVSGAAPLGFAPTIKDRVRYSDGASGTPIPARILKDYGADFVVACNCVPGPKRGNPLARFPLFKDLPRAPVIGRFVDLWVAAAFLLQQISRETSEDAHVYVEAPGTDTPFLESVGFWRGDRIVQDSARSHRMKSDIRKCRKSWVRFRKLYRPHPITTAPPQRVPSSPPQPTSTAQPPRAPTPQPPHSP